MNAGNELQFSCMQSHQHQLVPIVASMRQVIQMAPTNAADQQAPSPPQLAVGPANLPGSLGS